MMRLRPSGFGSWNGVLLSLALLATPRAHTQQLEAVASTVDHRIVEHEYDMPPADPEPDPARDPFSTLVLARPATADRNLHMVQLSGSASGGYDSATSGIVGQGGYMAEAEGHVALSRVSRRYDLLLEHDAKAYRAFAGHSGLEQFQHTTAWLSGAHSVRTDWALVAENAFGSADPQTAGSLTDLSSIVVVPTTTTAVLPYQPGNEMYDRAQFNLQHLLTRRDTVSFNAGALYRHFFALDQSSNQFDAGVSLRRQLTESVVAGLQLDAVHQSYNQVQCTTAALSVLGSDDLSRTMRLTGSVGVLNGTAGCHGTYVFDSLFQYMPRPGHLLFVGVTRHNSDTYVQNTSWETSVFGGMRAGRVASLQARLDGGWTRYENASAIGGPSVSGMYASAEVRRNVWRRNDVALTARFFNTSNGITRDNRALVFLTYSWSRATAEEREEKLGYGK